MGCCLGNKGGVLSKSTVSSLSGVGVEKKGIVSFKSKGIVSSGSKGGVLSKSIAAWSSVLSDVSVSSSLVSSESTNVSSSLVSSESINVSFSLVSSESTDVLSSCVVCLGK